MSSERTQRIGNRQRADRVRRQWTSVALEWSRRVEEIERQSEPMTDALLSHAAIAAGDRVLELAAGPGALGPTLSALTGPRGEVVVSDLSPEMVAAAAVRNRHLANVRAEVRDLCAIDEPDGSFDVALCRMGLPFASAARRAVEEIRRILRPGGRFAALTWGRAEDNPWLTCVTEALARVGLLDSSLERHAAFSLSDVDRLRMLVEASGFGDVRIDEITLSFRAVSIDEHFERVTALAASLAEALKGAPGAAKVAARAVTAELVIPHGSATGVVLPASALVISGHR